VLEAAGVTTDAQKLSVLRAIDKLDKFGPEGVKLLLGAGRKDESGDFTKGAGLSDEQATVVLDYVGGASVDNDGTRELASMQALFDSAGYGADRIKIDPSVVRGLEYYTGPVFEIELTFKVQNEKGQDVVFGSVGGGGRYDGLVSRFRSEPVPATGFSIGVSRLANALKLTGNLGATEPVGPVVVLVMDKEQTARYQAITSALRKAGIRAEMFMGNTKNFGKQVAYADKRNAPAVIIEGSQERENNKVQIKDLIVGKEAAAGIKDNAEYKAARPGQFECDWDLESIVAAISALPAVAAYLKANK
jgi:histidyl-tRNA synthetase